MSSQARPAVLCARMFSSVVLAFGRKSQRLRKGCSFRREQPQSPTHPPDFPWCRSEPFSISSYSNQINVIRLYFRKYAALIPYFGVSFSIKFGLLWVRGTCAVLFSL